MFHTNSTSFLPIPEKDQRSDVLWMNRQGSQEGTVWWQHICVSTQQCLVYSEIYWILQHWKLDEEGVFVFSDWSASPYLKVACQTCKIQSPLASKLWKVQIEIPDKLLGLTGIGNVKTWRIYLPPHTIKQLLQYYIQAGWSSMFTAMLLYALVGDIHDNLCVVASTTDLQKFGKF